jgi:hypothetical protein
MWVLILSLFTPGGDLIEQQRFPVKDRQACLEASQEMKDRLHPMHIKYKTKCVKEPKS